MNGFTTISGERFSNNPLQLFRNGFLLSAGSLEGEQNAGASRPYNAMTCGWGTAGTLWGREVLNVYVRPGRHTFQFMESGEVFAANFFTEENRDVLQLFGTRSGRDLDKVAQTGLTPLAGHGTVYFAQANLVIFARKIAWQDMEPGHFVDKELEKLYPLRDYHRIYTGEILEILEKA
jgi:flavin reductase (DIM6/NTAB) family NADH-FMN oxidoreductase RutF